MSIKNTLRFSFGIIIFLVGLIFTINTIFMYQIKENNISKKNITEIVYFQEEMNSLIKDITLTDDLKKLEYIKDNFIKYEKKFEEKKESIKLNNDDNDFLDYFIQDIHNDKLILNYLEKLYKNEKKIEDAFENVYKLQKEKITLLKNFDSEYPNEKRLRKKIEKIIMNRSNVGIVKNFGDIKYYSKETLFQHKDQNSLDKWMNEIITLKNSINGHDKLFNSYIKTVNKIATYAIRIREIEQIDTKLKNYLLMIIKENKKVDLNIENDIKKLTYKTMDLMHLTMTLLLIFTIVFIMILEYKVGKNVGLSVDEIEEKVQQGLETIYSLNKEIEVTQQEVVFTMGAIGERRSKETGNHVKRVAEYSKLFALYYGLDEKEAEMLKQASPMHDIGKVAIPDAILNKPGRFDDKERGIMNTHVELGYDMLKGSKRPLLKMAAIVAYEHHEKWDGTGYPRGLKGKEIHIYGRITAIADVFDALGSARVYKPAWDDERIFNLFKEERGKHFEPKLVDIFFEHLDQFLEIRDRFKDV